MATADRDPQTPEELRREIADERAALTESVGALRKKVRAKLPFVAAGGVGLGFAVSGGLRATVRALWRRLRR